MEHVEVLRDLSEVCRAAIKAGDWKVDGACDPDAALRRADAAIASLSAPQPPAEAQPVACDEDRFEQFLQAAIARSPEPLRELGEYLAGVLDDDQWPAADRLLLQLATATPSAPVGVEGLPERWRREAPQAGVDSGEDAARAYREAMHWCAFQLEEALAQQPAAVDGADAQDAEIEALRAEVDQAQASARVWRRLAETTEARAERLAEVLLELCNVIDGHEVPVAVEGKAAHARDALRDHDQEVSNG